MAATLEQLQARLDALNTARASGIRSVEYAGHRAEYRSDQELAAAITAIERQIDDVSGSVTLRQYRFTSDKAL